MRALERKEATFARWLNQLVEFKKRFGHCDVKKGGHGPEKTDFDRLARWLSRQRSDYLRGLLTPEHVALLENQGVNFGGGLRHNDKEVADKMALLKRYRRDTRRTGVPSASDPNSEYASLGDWILRARRYHAGGTLPASVVATCEAEGIDLGRNMEKVKASSDQVERTFQENLDRLADWLEEKEAQTGDRDLAYRDRKTSACAVKCYRFIEHMVLKERQSLLSEEHKTQLEMLAFTVNAKPIGQVLDPAPARRTQDGAAMARAAFRVKRAAIDADEAELRAQEAVLHANTVAEDAMAHIRAVVDEVVKVDQAAPLPPHTGYVTTEELSKLINFDARTIREVIVKRHFTEGRHFIRPFGRKMLFIPEAIMRDMRAGLFIKPRHARE